MSKYAKTENGIVTNIIEGQADGYISCGDEVNIGWTYSNNTFSAPADVRTYEEKRGSEYPQVTDQLDAILKYLSSSEFDSSAFPQDLTNIISDWEAVKLKYPKS